MPGDLNNPIFQSQTKARKWLEARVWPDGGNYDSFLLLRFISGLFSYTLKYVTLISTQ